MSDHSLVRIAATFALLSLVAVGGANAVLPEMQRQVVDAHQWMSNADFARAFAIAQSAPGPNVMIASVIGWRVSGLTGLLIATLGMVAPSCLIAFGVGRLFHKIAGAPWFPTARDGLAPVPVGLMLASGMLLARAADADALSFVLTGAGALFVLFTRRNPFWILVAGALFGVVAGRFGWW